MKNTKLKRSRLSSFLTGKGFYIAICLSIAVVSATAYFVINTTRNNLSDQNSNNISIDTGLNEWSFPNTPVDGTQSNVPKDSASDSQTQPSESESQSTAASANNSTSQPTQTFSNTFVMPLKGELLNEFSNGKPVKSKTMNDWRTHDGVDIKAAIATPVKSSSDGIVKSIDQDPMWGVVITIDHGNGYETMYMGLNVNVSVKKDQKVEIGTVLGSVGETAKIEGSEEPHLHFAMKKDGEWVDPMSRMQNA
ncbi:MAG: M23 family metallopeptidase [Oscillospiraceae bacterium]|nr:M23 family metallopeptidase [Oscillospiraceae bacterium]